MIEEITGGEAFTKSGRLDFVNEKSRNTNSQYRRLIKDVMTQQLELPLFEKLAEGKTAEEIDWSSLSHRKSNKKEVPDCIATIMKDANCTTTISISGGKVRRERLSSITRIPTSLKTGTQLDGRTICHSLRLRQSRLEANKTVC